MKTCLVVGSAACVWDDLDRAPECDMIIGVNQIILDCPLDLRCGATVHPENAKEWSRRCVPIYAPHTDVGVTHVYFEEPFQNGSAGLYGVGVALHLGADRVVLAGIPLDDQPHYGRHAGDREMWLRSIDTFRDFWQRALPLMKGRVVSLSGWTKTLLD